MPSWHATLLDSPALSLALPFGVAVWAVPSLPLPVWTLYCHHGTEWHSSPCCQDTGHLLPQRDPALPGLAWEASGDSRLGEQQGAQ